MLIETTNFLKTFYFQSSILSLSTLQSMSELLAYYGILIVHSKILIFNNVGLIACILWHLDCTQQNSHNQQCGTQ